MSWLPDPKGDVFLTIVSANPPPLSYGNGEVNTPESKPLVLENCSECDVKYKLFYIANKEPPLRQSSRGGRVAIVGHIVTQQKHNFFCRWKTSPSTQSTGTLPGAVSAFYLVCNEAFEKRERLVSFKQMN